MNKQQTASLLKEAANEIQRLRQTNSSMSARLDMFDRMIALFEANTNRNGHGLMSPDIFHELRKAAEVLESESVQPDIHGAANSLGMPKNNV